MGPGPTTMAIGGRDAVGPASSGQRFPFDVASGVDPGVAVEAVAGFLVGLGLVLVDDVGLAVGLGVGFGAGLGFGLGVGAGVGFGVAGTVTTIVPGETLERVTVLAPPPVPLVAEKLYPYVPAASLRPTVKVTPAFQFDPEAVIGTDPIPAIVTTTLDGAQPALSRYWTAKPKVVVGLPLPGETVPPARLG
jgi:hypothetical protein